MSGARVRAVRTRGRRPVAGAILLETLLAIALFAGAALFVIGALRDSAAATERAALRTRAADLARTALSEIEAGLASESEVVRRESGVDDGLRLEVRTAPSAFEGLTLVEVAVRADAGDGGESILVTLRQLVRMPSVRKGTEP